MLMLMLGPRPMLMLNPKSAAAHGKGAARREGPARPMLMPGDGARSGKDATPELSAHAK